MSPNDMLDGRPDFTRPPGKPLEPDTIVPEDDAALSEPMPKAEEEKQDDQSQEKPDDEHSEGIPARWSEG